MAGTMRDVILGIAKERFASVGFEATTMRSIASRAGVTLPTIYHYFDDKANLYLQACMATFAPRAERAQRAFARSAASEEQKILRFFIDLATDLLEDEHFFKLLHREMIDQDQEGIRTLTEGCWKQPFTTLSAAFKELLPRQRDPVEVTLTCFALMLGLVNFRRNATYLSSDLGRYYRARPLAELVLNTTVPQIAWSALHAEAA